MTSPDRGGDKRGAGRAPNAGRRVARRLALAAVFEADFGHRTAVRALEQAFAERDLDADVQEHARGIVEAVVRHRDSIDSEIEAAAPAYPVVGLARIDRALLRSAIGELLHCPATPTRVAIAEWVALARSFSGEPARRLVNGVLGRVAADAAEAEQGSRATANEDNGGA
jgi:N utilization substance protein B